MAGSLAWVEGVEVQHDGDSGLTTVTQQDIGPRFSVADFASRYSGSSDDWEILVDYRGTAKLLVTAATWNVDYKTEGDVVPLLVYSFPASPRPPQIDSPPTGSFLFVLDLPSGRYAMPMTIDLGGPGCYLLETDAGTGHQGAPVVNLAAVPVPPSIVLLGLGAALAG
jgi:hypothetical protein